MNLFLEGNIGVGKTSLILDQLRNFSGNVAGFISVRLVNESEETVAFALQDVRKAFASVQHIDQTQIPSKDIFLRGNKSYRTVDLSVFSRIESFLQDAMQADVVVLDELGGIEMQVERFRQAVYPILQSEIPCVGTFKSCQNYQHMKQHVSMPVHEQEALRLRNWMTEQQDTQLLTCNCKNRTEIQQKLECFFNNAK